MRYEYEKACKDAGMSEEAIAQLRRLFDADYKKLKRLNNRLMDEENQFCIFYRSDLEAEDDEMDGFELIDTRVDVEGDIIHSMMLSELDTCLAQLAAVDQRFILKYFSFRSKAVQQTAVYYGYTSAKVIWHRDRIVKMLQGMLRDGM